MGELDFGAQRFVGADELIEIEIPGYQKLELEHLVLDYNGTLACDGELLEGVGQRLQALSQQLQIHVVTADTFGKVREQMAGLACQVVVLPLENQAAGKLNYITELGVENSVCMGNGRNDRLMLEAAALGVVLVQEEGAAVATIMAADVVCPDIRAALDLLVEPLRLVATLRS